MTPRLAGLTGTTLAHAALIAAAVVARRAPETAPFVYAVDLVAAPLPAETPRRAAEEAPPVEKEEVASVSTKTPPPKKTPDPDPVPPKQPQRIDTPIPVKSTTPPLPGEAPSTGRDVATVKNEGFKSQYPEYVENIVQQVLKKWVQPAGARSLRTEVAFVIEKDGSVAGIEVVVRSGSYAFDLAARAAVEAAGNARAFGPLPAGVPGGSLPVTFYFAPRGTP